MIETIVSVILGGIVSGIITYLVSRWFYRRATRDLEIVAAELKAETEKVRRLSTAMVRGMERQGWIKAEWDEDGNLKGWEETVHVKTGIVGVSGLPAKIHTSTTIQAKAASLGLSSHRVTVFNDLPPAQQQNGVTMKGDNDD